MVVDYRERKQVSKNRPKSKPTGIIAAAAVMASLVSFALGVLVDRYLLPPREQKTAAAPPAPGGGVAQQPPQQTVRAPGAAASAPAPPQPAAEPSLTFYNTLSKGGKTILGSGLNPHSAEIRSATPARSPAPTPPVETSPQPAAKAVPSTGKSEDARDNKPGVSPGLAESRSGGEAGKDASAKKASSPKGTYSVQVASSKERKEAEAIRSKLAEKGFAAYIVESTVPGKGTWYRVKVGKQMDQPAASDMASLLGKGAIVIPE